jgi:hypothetical protein
MLTIKELFAASGLDTPPDQIKLIRHVDHLDRSIRQIIAEGHFDLYQAEQNPSVRPFHNCKTILSFIGVENNKAEFYGAYRVLGYRPLTPEDRALLPDFIAEAHKDEKPRIWCNLEELPAFTDYRGRLIIQWKSTRGWHQKKDLEVYEVLPPTIARPFPGYQDVVLKLEELRAIFADPRSHRDWDAALKANAGIYRIVDLSTGEIYIGSAYGSEGLWGRWKVYGKTGHGNNKHLLNRDPKDFQWSIVRTLSTTMSAREVIGIEQTEKEKHGSRAHGLNAN